MCGLISIFAKFLNEKVFPGFCEFIGGKYPESEKDIRCRSRDMTFFPNSVMGKNFPPRETEIVASGCLDRF